MKSQITTTIVVIIVILAVGALGYYGYNKFFVKPATVVATPTPIPENNYLQIKDISIFYKTQKITTLKSGINNYTLVVNLNSSSKTYACKVVVTSQTQKINAGFKDQLVITLKLNPAGEKVLFSLTCDSNGLEKYTSFTVPSESIYGLDAVCAGKNNGDEVTGAIQGIYSDFPLFCYQGFPYNVARICNDKRCLNYNNSFTPKLTFKTKQKIDQKVFQPQFDYVNLTGKYNGFILLKYNSSLPDQYCAFAQLGDGTDQYKYNFFYRNNGETNSTDYLIYNGNKYGYNNNTKYFCYNSSYDQRNLRYGCFGVLNGFPIASATYKDKSNNTINTYNISQYQFMDALNYSGCNVCNPQIDSTKLTLYSQGRIGNGTYCTQDGIAIRGCMINGKLYKDQEFTGLCTMCDASKNDSKETIADNIRYNNSIGVWCVKGREIIGCNVGNDQIIPRGQDRSEFTCQTCNPIVSDPQSDVRFTPKTDGIPCGPNQNTNFNSNTDLKCYSGFCMSNPSLIFSLGTFQNVSGTVQGYGITFNTTGSVSLQISPDTTFYSKISFNYYGKPPKKLNELYPENQSLNYYYDTGAFLYSQRREYNRSGYTNLVNFTNFTCNPNNDGTDQCYTEIPSETIANTSTRTTLFLKFRNTLLTPYGIPYYFELITSPSLQNCTNYTTSDAIVGNTFNYIFNLNCITGADQTVDHKGDCNLEQLSQFAPLCSVFGCKDQNGLKYYLVSQNIYGSLTKFPDYQGNYTVDRCTTKEQCEALKSERSARVGCEDSTISDSFYAACNAPIANLYRSNYNKTYCENVIFARDPINR
ncbi:Uncharacterised protein [uncultured archaeon]|nr:Uncharacterised protein [uncultured archaeon]